jgi:hypothetical protein
VRVDLGVAVVVVVVWGEEGGITAQPVVLFSLMGLGLGLVGVSVDICVIWGGDRDGDRFLATFVGGGEVGESA